MDFQAEFLFCLRVYTICFGIMNVTLHMLLVHTVRCCSIVLYRALPLGCPFSLRKNLQESMNRGF